MRVTELQKDKIQRAYAEANSVLQQIKQRSLNPAELRFMKSLEEAVGILEHCMVVSTVENDKCEFFPEPKQDPVCYAGSEIDGVDICTKEYSKTCRWAEERREDEKIFDEME